MLVAYDKDKNRIYANSGVKYKECFCRECGELLVHKVGSHNAPHFAHKAASECSYGKEKDNKSPWHIHMQELFPKESLEVRFYDKVSGELKHIADVFLEDSNTVIEFQHSPISDKDFAERTLFHISEGRRIVWVFDESKEGAQFGRLKEADFAIDRWHSGYCFEWPRSPRKMLTALPTDRDMSKYGNYSVCLYLGEADIIHRIIYNDCNFYEIALSVHDIDLGSAFDIEDLFRPEGYWLSQSPWKEKINDYRKAEQAKKEAQDEAVRRQVAAMMNRRKPGGFRF